MKIIQRVKGYRQDPTRYFNFKRYSNQGGDFYLIEGGFGKKHAWNEYGFSEGVKKEIITKGVARLDFEEPNKFCLGDNSEYDKDFNKIFTICPYTAEWLNEQRKETKRVSICFPFNEEYILKKQPKKYDIIYMGHIAQNWLDKELDILRHYHYALVSNTSDSRVTHPSVSYEQKMNLVAQSKITLVHNVIHLQPKHILLLWTVPHFEKNKAFLLIPKRFDFKNLYKKDNEFIVPQIKSRTFEAAFARSLILCRKDPFNIIERFFVPGKEFIYYIDGTLGKTIDTILKNYSQYQKVIDNAFQKATKLYTTKAVFRLILKEYKKGSI